MTAKIRSITKLQCFPKPFSRKFKLQFFDDRVCYN